MQELLNLFRRFKVLSTFFALFVVAYLWNTLTAAPDKSSMVRYHITATQLRELTLAIVLPYIAIWIVGLIGYMWLRKYTVALGDSEDGEAFDTVSKGVLLLILWLPVSVIISGFMERYYVAHPASTATAIRFINYSNIVLLFPAFYLIYVGTKKLLRVAKVKYHGLTQRQSILYAVFASVYTFIALSDVSRQVAHSGSHVATYYLPDWLTLLTIIIPRLLTWFLGFAAVGNIFLYRQKVKGALYREALRDLAIGLGVVVVGVCFLRITQSLSSVLGSWSIGLLVLLVYVLLFVLGLGYFMLAKGARRLLRIEEL